MLDVITRAEAWQVAGNSPLNGRWTECSKGGAGTHGVLCLRVANEVAYHRNDQFSANSPP